jgi:molybdenum cofactor cytidylyltransferase
LRIVGIMLAAGEGRRFGGDKLLAALPDGTAVGVQSLRNMLAVLPEVVAVTRPEDEALQASLAAEGARVEICPRAAEGMGASLAHGVRAAADADGWIVALGDMPKIRPATIRTLSEALIGGALIAAPIYAGSRGHPVAFAAALGPRLAA